MIRKNTRFRLYVAFLSLAYVLGFGFLLNRQAAAYRRRMDRMEARFNESFERLSADLEKRSAEGGAPASQQERSESLKESSDDVYRGPVYFVEGSGISRNWAYLDVLFYDGYRARYFFRKGSPSDLRKAFRRLELDAYLRRWGVGGVYAVRDRPQGRDFDIY